MPNTFTTDGAETLCDAYALKHPFIKVIHTANSGVSSARNQGINASQGKYLIFLDSDDFWLDQSFPEIIKIINRYPQTDLFMMDYSLYDYADQTMVPYLKDRKSELSLPVKGELFFKTLLKNNPHFAFTVCRLCIKRSFVLDHGLFFQVPLYYEDVMWVSKALLAAESVFYCPKRFYVYCQNTTTQITSNLSYEKIIDRLWISAYWLENAPLLISDATLRKLFLKRISDLYFSSLIRYRKICPSSTHQEILNTLKKNMAYLDYPNTLRDHGIAMAVRLFGFQFVSRITGTLFEFKTGSVRQTSFFR